MPPQQESWCKSIMSLKQNNSAIGRDDLDEGGLLVVPPTKDTKMYRIREVVDYCKEKGIRPNQLTDEELKQFEVKRPK